MSKESELLQELRECKNKLKEISDYRVCRDGYLNDLRSIFYSYQLSYNDDVFNGFLARRYMLNASELLKISKIFYDLSQVEALIEEADRQKKEINKRINEIQQELGI